MMCAILLSAVLVGDDFPTRLVGSPASSWPLVEAGQKGLLTRSFVFPPDTPPTPACHASTVCPLADGRVAVAWFGGTSEPDLDTAAWFTTGHRDAAGSWTWQPPRSLADGTEEDGRDHRIGNPVLLELPGQRGAAGRLLLFYKVVAPKPWRELTWWGMVRESGDGGQMWSPPRRLGTSERLGSRRDLIGPVKNRPLVLSGGAVLSPSSSEHDGWRLHLERSDDGGRTWEVIGPLQPGDGTLQAIQPSLLRHDGGRLQLLARTRKAGVLAESWSNDEGRTWSPPTATAIPNPNSGTDAVTLADGRHLLVFNPTERTRDDSGRGRLALAISDDGRTWRGLLRLEDEPGQEYSYPAVAQATDGTVHVTYTWRREAIRHLSFDPDALVAE